MSRRREPPSNTPRHRPTPTAEPAALHGVPETALIPLFDRAAEAARPDSLLLDPLAVETAAGFSASVRQRFGRPGLRHVVRAIQFDGEVRAFLQRHPSGTVMSLGEGLETELWRVDNGAVEWVSVDLPEMIALRQRLLPAHPRNRLAAVSALDEQWTRLRDPNSPLLILAQGLLMYFTRAQVRTFFAMVSDLCPGARIVFETIPDWASTSRAGHRQANGYRLPAQPWGTGGRALGKLLADAGIRDLHRVPAPQARGVGWGYLYPWTSRLCPGLLPMTVVADTAR